MPQISDIVLILYTHSDYSDAWPAFFGQIDKYWPKENVRYVFIDCEDSTVPRNWIQLPYPEQLQYTDRFSIPLGYINEEYCLLHHEDMILYDKPHFDNLQFGLDLISSDSPFNFVKLLRGPEKLEGTIGLVPIALDSPWIFSIQPCLWRTESLLKVYEALPNTPIWEFEEKAQSICRQIGVRGFVSYFNEDKRGRAHWDSDLYPYIATAIVKGKWNMAEYPRELGQIANKYNIDLSIRGTNVSNSTQR